MLDIVFISDYVCPYCYVAKQALKEAMRETGIACNIRYQPYELSPEGKPQVDTYHDEVRRSHYQVLIEPCKRMNLDMKLPPAIVPRPRTRFAFEGWLYAREHGLGEQWDDRMYAAYFTDELDIGDLKVLTDIAGQIGMDQDDFTRALLHGQYTALEQKMVRNTRENWSFKGVPAVFIDGEPIELREYTKEEAIRILEGRRDKTQHFGACCDENGCHMGGQQ